MSMRWMIHFCKFSLQKINSISLSNLMQFSNYVYYYISTYFRVCRESDMDDEVTKIFKKWKINNNLSVTKAGQTQSYNSGKT